MRLLVQIPVKVFDLISLKFVILSFMTTKFKQNNCLKTSFIAKNFLFPFEMQCFFNLFLISSKKSGDSDIAAEQRIVHRGGSRDASA
jgi:hypothetical protein